MANKETRDLYRGRAIIMNVSLEGVDDWKDWEKRDLSDADKASAFKIVYDVAEGEPTGARHDVKVEISHRQLKGKMLDYLKREDGEMPTQMDVAIRSLVGQGILPRGAQECDIGAATEDALCGREVTIRAYEELGNDGATWWPRCAFASARQMITGADNKAARVAAFLAGKPAPKPTPVKAKSAAASMPPAPSEDGFGSEADLPF